MKIRKIASIGVAAGLLAGGIAVATPAMADPVTSGYALVGSDTLQDSANALVNGSSVTGAGVRVASNGVFLGSFDAFGSSLIRTKNTGGYFTRPGGSGAGVNALRASITGNAVGGYAAGAVTNQVDIARSSSGPGSNANANGLLVYVPYARDAVSYAYRVPASDTTTATALASLTATQLTAIYSAAAPTAINGHDITPRLPQINSGTRSFFLGALGLGTSGPGTAVPSGDNLASGPQENTGGQINDYEIIPFSAASWIAQSNNAAPNTIASDANLHLGAIGGTAAYTGSGTSLVPNQAFYDSATFGRDTYLIVEYARVNPSDPKYDANLAKLVDSTQGTSSLVSFNTAVPTQPGAVKAKFGFRPPSTTTTQRAFASL